MNKQHRRALFAALLFSVSFSFFGASSRFAVAQERSSQSSSNKTEVCTECCETCREKFYSECSLSPTMVDNFNVLNEETEMARLDNFAQSINSSPEADAYVVIYGGKLNKYGELERRAGRIKKYLLGVKKLDPSRIIFVVGGFREKFGFELWLSPVKNSYPPLTPTVSVEKVKFNGKF